MKHKFYLILLILAFNIYTNADAQEIRINSFEINPTYLQNETILVKDETNTTPFKYKFSLSRDLKSTGGWYDGNCIVYIAYSKSGDFSQETSVNILDSISINNNFFKNASGGAVGDTYYVTHSSNQYDSKVPIIPNIASGGGTIAFKLKFYDISKQKTVITYSSKKYTITKQKPPTFYNVKKRAAFKKNDCSQSFEYPMHYYYNVEANKYSSIISQADANSKAELEIAQNGQTSTNLNGLCYLEMPRPRETIRLHRGYLEDINWNSSFSPQDQTVKIELLIRKGSFDATPGEDFVLFKVLYEDAPNTGKVIGGLDSSIINFPNIGDYRVKITAKNSNIYYLTDLFSLEADRD